MTNEYKTQQHNRDAHGNVQMNSRRKEKNPVSRFLGFAALTMALALTVTGLLLHSSLQTNARNAAKIRELENQQPAITNSIQPSTDELDPREKRAMPPRERIRMERLNRERNRIQDDTRQEDMKQAFESPEFKIPAPVEMHNNDDCVGPNCPPVHRKIKHHVTHNINLHGHEIHDIDNFASPSTLSAFTLNPISQPEVTPAPAPTPEPQIVTPSQQPATI